NAKNESQFANSLGVQFIKFTFIFLKLIAQIFQISWNLQQAQMLSYMRSTLINWHNEERHLAIISFIELHIIFIKEEKNMTDPIHIISGCLGSIVAALHLMCIITYLYNINNLNHNFLLNFWW
ncbi:hypothetical protein ACJX0J_029940, partial [Zea mays]